MAETASGGYGFWNGLQHGPNSEVQLRLLIDHDVPEPAMNPIRWIGGPDFVDYIDALGHHGGAVLFEGFEKLEIRPEAAGAQRP
jgi:hypothetical protein